MLLRFANGEHRDVVLTQGQLAIGSAPGAAGIRLSGQKLAPVHAMFAADRRGFWLTLPTKADGVHVNARPIRQLAYLRAGDLVCVGDVQIRLISDHPLRAIPAKSLHVRTMSQLPADASMALPRASLRGQSGNWFGRSLSLAQPRSFGRSANCDVRLEDPSIADKHALIEIDGHKVLLRMLVKDQQIKVNGQPVGDVELSAGDQLEIGEVRFLLEAPGLTEPTTAKVPEKTINAPAKPVKPPPMTDYAVELTAQRRDRTGLIWLIAASAMLAAVVTALIVYAPR